MAKNDRLGTTKTGNCMTECIADKQCPRRIENQLIRERILIYSKILLALEGLGPGIRIDIAEN